MNQLESLKEELKQTGGYIQYGGDNFDKLKIETLLSLYNLKIIISDSGPSRNKQNIKTIYIFIDLWNNLVLKIKSLVLKYESLTARINARNIQTQDRIEEEQISQPNIENMPISDQSSRILLGKHFGEKFLEQVGVKVGGSLPVYNQLSLQSLLKYFSISIITSEAGKAAKKRILQIESIWEKLLGKLKILIFNVKRLEQLAMNTQPIEIYDDEREIASGLDNISDNETIKDFLLAQS